MIRAISTAYRVTRREWPSVYLSLASSAETSDLIASR